MKPAVQSTFESTVREILDEWRDMPYEVAAVHTVAGEIAWMSGGAFGPDEHEVANEAVMRFSSDKALGLVQVPLGDNRVALAAPLRLVRGNLRGVFMLLLDSRLARSRHAQIAAVLRIERLRRLAQQLDDAGVRTVEVKVADEPATSCAPAPAVATPEVRVIELSPLRRGPHERRFDVLTGDVDIKIALAELVRVLAAQRGARSLEHCRFMLTLEASTLEDAAFLDYAEQLLSKAKLPPRIVGFAIAESAAAAARERTLAFLNRLQSLACPVALDNFLLRLESSSLFPHPWIRLLKIHPLLTTNLRTHKIAQARVAAIVRFAQVLGLRTAAKAADNREDYVMLKTLGVDFAPAGDTRPLATLKLAGI
ncbi:MAG: EAL domain-containing protein [Steroidobacteraceae bacterium]|nr:EAL domain-containing protein [Steroidobacteraceae bacterium]MDW8258423.1 EAL domain-containing protein [Gammaproteobacteria bacterium]